VTGEVFGPYRLMSLIGRGGMGEVWQAVDTVQGDRTVALKLLGSWLNGDPQFARRFQRESAMAARLTSPHIVPIHRYGEIDGRLYLDMQLIEGSDLGALIAGAPLSPPRAVEIITQVARLHWRSMGRIRMPMVIRVPYGGGIGSVEHHGDRIAGVRRGGDG